jgi:hypothetical protein
VKDRLWLLTCGFLVGFASCGLLISLLMETDVIR